MENANHFLANYHQGLHYASARDAHTPYGSRFSQSSSFAHAFRNDPQQQSPYFVRSGTTENLQFEPRSPEIERPLDDFGE